jgi:hypothetical protein
LGKSPDQVEDVVLDAVRNRPKDVGTPTGLAIQVAYPLGPGLVDAVVYQGYRVFPGSAAAGGRGRAKLGKGERGLSAAAAAARR